MMKKAILWLFLFLILTGCSDENLYHIETSDNDEWIAEELGAFSQWIFLETEEEKVFTRFYFEGGEIRIPYALEGVAEGINSEFGLIFMIDGIAMRTHLEFSNSVIFREASYLHDFSLADGQRYAFDVVFPPLSYAIEGTVAISVIAIFSPDSIPSDIDDPRFYSSNTIVSTMFIEMVTKQGVRHIIGNEKQGYQFTGYEEIASVIHTFHRPWLIGNESIEELLVEAPRLMLFPQDIGLQVGFEDIIFVEDEDQQLSLSLLVYGGVEARSRITFFINHDPVRVNGFDFIELELPEGKMAVIDIEFDPFDFEAFNSLYGIMVPIEQNYWKQGIFGSRPLLIVSK